MLFMKCTENECVPDCGKCKKYKKRSHTFFWKFQINSQILTSALLVQLQKEETLEELGYLKGGVLEPYKVSWCPFVE